MENQIPDNPVKIVFFDIDGTLIGIHNQKIPVSAVKAIEALRLKGIKVFISTGRHMLDIKVLDLPDFDGYITTNGASCTVGKEVIYKKHIPEDDIENLIHYLQGDGKFPCVIETFDNAYLNFSNHWVEELQKELHIRKPLTVSFEEWTEKARSGVEQMLCFFGPESDERIIREVLPGCTTKRWCPYFTDVIEKNCDKSKGIDFVLGYLNLPIEETMAFGDGGNDIQMLQHAGTGIAMGNASPHVKAVADYVTDSVENDGIWKALVHFGLI